MNLILVLVGGACGLSFATLDQSQPFDLAPISLYSLGACKSCSHVYFIVNGFRLGVVGGWLIPNPIEVEMEVDLGIWLGLEQPFFWLVERGDATHTYLLSSPLINILPSRLIYGLFGDLNLNCSNTFSYRLSARQLIN